MNRKVKALLIEKGIKQKDIASSLGLTPGNVSAVISGHYESHRVKQAVADALGVPYKKIWGRAA